MRVYTIPYAGGFAFTYYKWKKYLDKQLKLAPIEFPGRGSKTNDLLCTSIEGMAETAYDQLQVNNEDYILFGHSMGAYVLLELYKMLERTNKPLPKQVILSGMKPPHLYVQKNYHLLDDEGFKEKIAALGGLPTEIMEDKEFAAYILKLLRNDFRAVEEYTTQIKTYFSCKVNLFNSEKDISREQILEWNLYSETTCDYHPFNGSHFFINESTHEVVQTINELSVIERVLI